MNSFKSSVGGAPILESVILVPSSGGRYEISVDGAPIYSKAQTRQHVADDEVIRLVKEHLASLGR